MKFIIAFAALVAIVAAAPAEVPESQAETIKSNVDQAPNGEYTVGVETSNKITIDEQGKLKSVPNPENDNKLQDVIVASGKISWVSPEGELITLTYVADENGFQPQGSHLPTPPPAL